MGVTTSSNVAATYEPIVTYTFTSATNTYTFSSIPSTYTDLILVTQLTANSVALDFGIRVNLDTGTNYSATYLSGNGTAAGGTRTTNSTLWGGWRTAVSTTSGNFVGISQFQNYANTSVYKTLLNRFNSASYGTEATVGLYRSTSAISSITVLAQNDNFASGSTITLYGLKAA